VEAFLEGADTKKNKPKKKKSGSERCVYTSSKKGRSCGKVAGSIKKKRGRDGMGRTKVGGKEDLFAKPPASPTRIAVIWWGGGPLVYAKKSRG